MKNLKEYQTKLEKMNGFELRAEEMKLKETYGQKAWTKQEWAEIKEVCEVFLEVQNKKGKEVAKKYNKKFSPRGFVGFLR